MAASPITIAAVDAMFASTHEAATTLAVRQRPATGRPVDGSMMWWRTTPPRVHRRTVVLEVAIPPDWMVMVSSSSSMGALLSSLICTAHPSGGGSPATAMSPPRLTSTPPAPTALYAAAAPRSTASALAVAPRSISTLGGIHTVLAASSNWIAFHPGTWLTDRRIGGPSARIEAKSRL